MNWIIEQLKWLIAGKELQVLHRFRVAAALVWRWNGQKPNSAETAKWIADVGEGTQPANIEHFRDSLITGNIHDGDAQYLAYLEAAIKDAGWMVVHSGGNLEDLKLVRIDAYPQGFTNDGDSEGQFIADGEHLNCPSCGGSGHVEDTLRTLLAERSYRTDGDLSQLAARCLSLSREDRALINMRQGTIDTLKSKAPAPVVQAEPVVVVDKYDPSQGVYDEASLRAAGRYWEAIEYHVNCAEDISKDQLKLLFRQQVAVERAMSAHNHTINSDDQYVPQSSVNVQTVGAEHEQ